MKIHSIERAIDAIHAGKFVIVADDEDRENEGDLIIAAEKVNEEKIAFMVRYTSGIICVPMLPIELERLSLSQMVQHNDSAYGTAFTVSVDAKAGVTTGVSAADRVRTIRALADPGSHAEDFAKPGHIFPLRYHPGGVLARDGHTEATVDLCVLAGLHPAGVLCELVNDDGSMQRMPDLAKFSQRYDIPLVTIQDLKQYCSELSSSNTDNTAALVECA
ncbi:MAG: 3,4-dihydroxy-2-butanone-4-phosphate synthase [Pseudomonadota bacterium]